MKWWPVGTYWGGRSGSMRRRTRRTRFVFCAGTHSDTRRLAYTELCTAGPTDRGRVCAPSIAAEAEETFCHGTTSAPDALPTYPAPDSVLQPFWRAPAACR